MNPLSFGFNLAIFCLQVRNTMSYSKPVKLFAPSCSSDVCRVDFYKTAPWICLLFHERMMNNLSL